MKKVSKLKPDEITATEAAKLMGVDDSTVYRYIKRGWIPGNKIGHTVILKKTVPTKFKIALQMPGNIPWHQKIEWTKEDLFDFDSKQMELKPVVNASDREKSKELFNMAARFKELGERSLSEQTLLRAAEVM